MLFAYFSPICQRPAPVAAVRKARKLNSFSSGCFRFGAFFPAEAAFFRGEEQDFPAAARFRVAMPPVPYFTTGRCSGSFQSSAIVLGIAMFSMTPENRSEPGPKAKTGTGAPVWLCVV